MYSVCFIMRIPLSLYDAFFSMIYGVCTVRIYVMCLLQGAGKTSVVAPLLALILADGKSLVLSVVPKALVEMSRSRMRGTAYTYTVFFVFYIYLTLMYIYRNLCLYHDEAHIHPRLRSLHQGANTNRCCTLHVFIILYGTCAYDRSLPLCVVGLRMLLLTAV